MRFRSASESKKLRTTAEVTLFTGPSAVVLLAVMLLPLVLVVFYSFFQNMVVDRSPFVGLRNYSLSSPIPIS